MIERRDRIIATDSSRCYTGSKQWTANNCSRAPSPMVLLPYEDAWIGYMVSQSVGATVGPVLLVQLADLMVMDFRSHGGRPVVSPSMISWHSRQEEGSFDLEARSVESWYRFSSGCTGTPRMRVDCDSIKDFVSCGGQQHQPCTVRVETAAGESRCAGNHTLGVPIADVSCCKVQASCHREAHDQAGGACASERQASP